MTEQRSTVRRSINSLGMRDGEIQESKLFSSVGKVLVCWLIWKHSDVLVNHSDTLFILLAFLILPDLVKKLLTMRFGGDTTTERTTMTKETSSAVSTG